MISRIVLNILLLIAIVSAELYSSLESIKAIIGAERDFPVMTNAYLERELERFDYLKKLAQEVQKRNDRAIRDRKEMMRHPINAFLLIKMMITDWNKILKIMRYNSANDVIRNVTRQRTLMRVNYPIKEDLSGAAVGLLRLQDTYQLDTKDIADGKILNSQMQTIALTAGDCFEIGRAAYHTYDYYHTILWMQEARERVENEVVPTANLEDIIEYLAFSLFEQGNLKRALLLTDELYRMNPDHPRAKDNVREYENLLENEGAQYIDMRRNIPPMNNVRDEKELDEGSKLLYEALCRQAMPVDTKAQLQLYCYYKMDCPYLRLIPFKVEIVRQNPLIVLFYNITSDKEAQIIQIRARSKMTEPEIGGRTVFMSNSKMSVPCIKNAALFWYNLMRNGEVDMRSLHAACPVLTGIKWTANKWFHERGQEWRRPCGLTRFAEERYVGDLGAPEPKYYLNKGSEARNPKKMNGKC